MSIRDDLHKWANHEWDRGNPVSIQEIAEKAERLHQQRTNSQFDATEKAIEASLAALAERNRAVEDRLGLIAMVDIMKAALTPFANAWKKRAPSGEPGTLAYERRMDRALEGFYSRGGAEPGDVLTGQHLKDAADILDGNDAPQVSLARRDAEFIGRLAIRFDREGNQLLNHGNPDQEARGKNLRAAATCLAVEANRLNSETVGVLHE